MKVGHFYSIVILIVTPSVTMGLLVDLSSYSSLIVLLHNFYRGYEKAADMKELKWDPYLQQRAEQWSENCYWGHQKRGLGENLAYFWTNGPDMSALDVIIKSCQNWWKEVNDWTWSTDCGAACHYTQMIWGKTSKIGCALSKCANMQMDSGNPINNANYFVCFYDPPGNFVGRYPYTIGDSCTMCDPGDTCQGGLCSSPAKPRPATSQAQPSANSQMSQLLYGWKK